MNNHVALHLALYPRDDGSYRFEARLQLPGEDAERRDTADLPAFDFNALRAEAANPAAYGQRLSRHFFDCQVARDYLVRAREAAGAQDPARPLRLRLHVSQDLPALHALHWETLHDPQRPGALLATDENVLFSRYLTSSDPRPVRRRPQGDLKALVVIANPADLDDYDGPDGRPLSPVNVRAELSLARDGLGSIPPTVLCSHSSRACSAAPTLNGMVRCLREGFDILYLVAHGTLIQGRPQVYLESPDGLADPVSPDGPDGLVSQLTGLTQLPRLVVLASCQSAGSGGKWISSDDGALAALGPRLAEIGVPAVVAMQGNVAMLTIEEFMPVFFEELQRDGQIDRAMAAARRAVQERPDWWMPVLFTRLESGRLFAPEESETSELTPELEVTHDYDLVAFRELLLAGFAADGLRRLIFYTQDPALRKLSNRFSSRDGLVDMVEKVLQYCEDQLLLPVLEMEVKDVNPRMYARFRDRLHNQ